MGKLLYSMIISLDGYVADANGNFDWAQPTEDALTVINDEMSNVGTFLYGRRMYEMMAVWETDPEVAAQSPESARFAETWCATDKIVYSRQLESTHTARTELVREFDPAEVTALKDTREHDLTVDGPTLAAEAFRHNLIDQVMVLVCPVTVGSGLAFWPKQRLNLELRQMRSFRGGVVYLSYDLLRH